MFHFPTVFGKLRTFAANGSCFQLWADEVIAHKGRIDLRDEVEGHFRTSTIMGFVTRVKPISVGNNV